VTKREELAAALVEAEVALANAAYIAAMVEGNRDDANAKLDKARALCRQLRAALFKLDSSA